MAVSIKVLVGKDNHRYTNVQKFSKRKKSLMLTKAVTFDQSDACSLKKKKNHKDPKLLNGSASSFGRNSFYQGHFYKHRLEIQ